MNGWTQFGPVAVSADRQFVTATDPAGLIVALRDPAMPDDLRELGVALLYLMGGDNAGDGDRERFAAAILNTPGGVA